MLKKMYNNLVYSYTLYIYKEYSQVTSFAYIIGLKTITHIFKFLLLHNIDHAIINTSCIKSYYYYCEFILQIQNNNIHSLNYTDASLFVFKKFINPSLPKDQFPCSNSILSDLLYYCETILLIIESNVSFENYDISTHDKLNPVIDLVSSITNYDEVNQCIVLILKRSKNSSMFIKRLTNVLLFTKKHGPIKNMFKLATHQLSDFTYLLE